MSTATSSSKAFSSTPSRFARCASGLPLDCMCSSELMMQSTPSLSPIVTCPHGQRYPASNASSKQSNKTKLNALHERTAWCNSAGFNDRLGRILEEGLGPQVMARMNLQPDLVVDVAATGLDTSKCFLRLTETSCCIS